MRYSVVLVLLLTILAAGQSLRAQTSRTAQDGVYTAAQAARGKALYFDNCVACHGDQLQGGEDSPPLAGVAFTHRWGGPILFRDSWTPVFDRHPASPNGIVLGAFAGHGVALSVYLGSWAAEIMLGRRNLPKWGKII